MKNCVEVDQPEQTRQHYFDFLRVFAAFAVMILHVSAENWLTADVYSLEWGIMNFYDSLVRWAVPVFVMISGALFLSRDITLKKIVSKYIFRIFTAFLFWSFIYAFDYYAKHRNVMGAIAFFVKGSYHLWFLFMITGLYLIIPFVKKIAESASLAKYFLLLAFISAFIIPELVQIISLFSEKYGLFAENVFNKFSLNFVTGFTSYFLLGYLLSKVYISHNAERLIYTAGIIGFILTILMSLCASRFKGEPFMGFYDYYNVNVLCEGIAVFVFFKAKFNRSVKIIRLLSQYSFGAYLVHVAVIMLLLRLGLNSLTFNPIISIPVISVIVFVISFSISAVLNNIPVLKRYIV